MKFGGFLSAWNVHIAGVNVLWFWAGQAAFGATSGRNAATSDVSGGTAHIVFTSNYAFSVSAIVAVLWSWDFFGVFTNNTFVLLFVFVFFRFLFVRTEVEFFFVFFRKLLS